jgi:hypothetical protein
VQPQSYDVPLFRFQRVGEKGYQLSESERSAASFNKVGRLISCRRINCISGVNGVEPLFRGREQLGCAALSSSQEPPADELPILASAFQCVQPSAPKRNALNDLRIGQLTYENYPATGTGLANLPGYFQSDAHHRAETWQESAAPAWFLRALGCSLHIPCTEPDEYRPIGLSDRRTWRPALANKRVK